MEWRRVRIAGPRSDEELLEMTRFVKCRARCFRGPIQWPRRAVWADILPQVARGSRLVSRRCTKPSARWNRDNLTSVA